MATNQELLKTYMGHADKSDRTYHENPLHLEGIQRIYDLAVAEAKQSLVRFIEDTEDEHVDCEHTFKDGAKAALQEVESLTRQK